MREVPDGKPAILLVEDDAALRAVVAEILEADGCTVAEAADPAGALAALRGRSFDLVITDGCGAPGPATSAAAAEVLRRAGPAPVVLFTARPVERPAALAAGFRDLIAKPFDLEDFQAKVRELLGTRPT